MTRPRKPAQLTPDQIEALASIGCTDTEIALLAGISEATLQRRFDAYLKRGRGSLKTRLRKAQIDKALAGDTTMLIWLGKVMLGQREKTEQTHDGGITIRVIDDDDDDPTP